MKILTVDDSIIVRKMVRMALEVCEEVSLVDTAPSAYAAREKLAGNTYDLIISDVNMPGESGVDFLKSIQESGDRTPVVFLSSMSEASVKSSLELLNVGALEIIPKPSGNSQGEVLEYLRNKIKPFFKVKQNRRTPQEPALSSSHSSVSENSGIELAPKAAISRPQAILPRKDVDCVVIGGSTGGPAALEKLLSHLEVAHIPYFCAIHMPEQFSQSLADRLNNVCKMQVILAQADMPIERGKVYLAQGGTSLKVYYKDRRLVFGYDQVPGPGEIYPSVDYLFSSVADVYGERALGVMLTGMGKDGLLGSTDLKGKGGNLIAQNKESCAVFGMPGAVFEAGLVDQLADVAGLSDTINRFVNNKSVKQVV